jgi:dsDNA-binding SOS-regulon protein
MAKTYESDITRFLRELKQSNPELEREQREGRAIWWDKNMDPELYKRFDESTVPQPAYVYQPKVD